ncbi:hypothetical protein M378DRAFT_66857 [Amanita muscaria Koide BX008]|uniref:Dihydroorotate oxidase n=1 Tax=Amanita muscaria (strain Koide BX008) TaxID=946122 RepID=A0A0C2XN70_AMAMK|nr:hypothetical protein M378DRAFT_66857 [Amanita muscaria Koide BX008]
MVDVINTIHISPPFINSSCAWSSDYHQLKDLYDCEYTGAVTTRTATLNGFKEDETHTVRFTTSTISTINSYGYSPYPLSTYLSWIEEILTSDPAPRHKPFIVSITSSDMDTLQTLVQLIQHLRRKLRDVVIGHKNPPIAIEFNTSCPNIPNVSPPAYTASSLSSILTVLAHEYSEDRTLTIGLKLPPYVYREQFQATLDAIRSVCIRTDSGTEVCPIAFLTCVNTLGNSLLYPDQVETDAVEYAVPTALGGLGGELMHPLALGNVYTFGELLNKEDNLSPLRSIKLFGVGGVTSKAAAQRMFKAGASCVGCATFFGKEGVQAFRKLQ